jgi:hypothetical protein
VLFRAGDQVPVMPLVEVVGKVANTPPGQMADIGLNVGVTGVQKLNVCPPKKAELIPLIENLKLSGFKFKPLCT